MKATVIKNSKVDTKEFGVLKVQELMNSSDNENLSISIVEVKGNNQHIKNTISDTYYFVISGSGVFRLNGDSFEVEAGDLAIIPKNNDYQDSGDMRLLAIASPRFKPENVEEV